MELVTIFLIWLAVTIIDNMSKRKKRRLPPPEDSRDFDIPTIANDPNLPGEEIPIFIETPNQAEIRPKKSSPPKKKISAREYREAEKTTELDLNLTPSNVMNAFVFSEILDKPKALRRKCF
ncbi:MAG: hypothetical protein IKO74_03960 [Selenomonadaceae bacterium]|nr:hypothetical protein [Selenomonadaceae bacterium]